MQSANLARNNVFSVASSIRPAISATVYRQHLFESRRLPGKSRRFFNTRGVCICNTTPTRSFSKATAPSYALNQREEERSHEHSYDITIVGGGIVGAATAMELAKKYPKLKMAILEKEEALGCHQSGHNSGVIHAGIYYKPGSLKAKLCVEGLHLSYKYLDENRIPYKKCGKLIVAVTPEEIPRLKDLYERGQQNNVPNMQLISKENIKDYEPYCKGLMAIWSPETGIVDWGQVTRSYGENFKKAGGKVHLKFPVVKFDVSPNETEYPVKVHGKNGEVFKSKWVLTCGGLHSDRLAEMSGGSRVPKIVPFRGEYLLLRQEKCNLIRGNIYPVPDPRFPFLGVHYTPRMDGSVWLGPNAVLAFKREGYTWADFSMKDLLDTLSYSGFRKLALKFAAFGTGEVIRSWLIRLQLKELQKYIPELTLNDIQRGPAGVRAQALDEEGNLVDDFIFDSGSGNFKGRILHVRNAPSPGATSSLAIAKMIAEKVSKEFSLSR